MIAAGWNVEALPEVVRAAVNDARVGIGPLCAWREAPTPALTIPCAIALVDGDACDRDLAGWIAGITMSVDHHRTIAHHVLNRGAHAVIPAMLAAFAAGVLLGVPMPKKQWRTVEQLALRSEHLPAELVDVLPIGLCHTFPAIRDIAQRIAVLAGGAGLAVVEAAIAASEVSDSKTQQMRAHERWLREARAAFVRPRPTGSARVDELLARMLSAWRDTRDPALEPLIGELGARAAYLRGPVVHTELDNGWLALARLGDASDLDRLFDSLWPSSEHAVRARVTALAALPPDPRLARLVDVAASRTVWTEDLHATVAALLASRPVACMMAPLARLEGPHAAVYDDVVHAVDQLAPPGQAPPELLAEADALLAPIRALEVLWRQHDADPGDLQLRAVLADALVADGDPRGELITLQLAGGEAADRRAQRLVAEHGATWDPVPGSSGATTYVRGFPVAATVALTDDDLRYTLHRRAWVTLERLAFTTVVDLAKLVARMPLLDTLLVARGEQLSRVADGGAYPRLHTLGCSDSWLPPDRAFPGLVTLGALVDADHAHRYRRLVERGVRTLHHRAYPSDWGPHGAARDHGPARVILGSTGGWRVAVPARGATLHVELVNGNYFYVPAVLEPLVALARHGIECVRLHIPGNPEPSAPVLEIIEALASRNVRVEPGAVPLEKLGFV